jgi:hypothetical protein
MPVLTTVPAPPRPLGRARVDLRRQAGAPCQG